MTVIGSRCEGALLYFAAVRWPQLTARWIGFTDGYRCDPRTAGELREHGGPACGLFGRPTYPVSGCLLVVLPPFAVATAAVGGLFTRACTGLVWGFSVAAIVVTLCRDGVHRPSPVSGRPARKGLS
jgi:hypothetical protein